MMAWGPWGADLNRKPVTVELRVTAEPDDDGVPAVTSTTRDWPGVLVQPASTTDTLSKPPHEEIVERFLASGPLAWWITATARILHDNDRCHIVDVRHYTSGALDHTEVIYERVKG